MFTCHDGVIQANGVVTLVMSGPVLSWMYSVIVWITYAVTKECRWSDKLSGIGLRTAWVVCALSWSMEYYKNNSPSDNNESSNGDSMESSCLVPPSVAVTILFGWLLSIYLCYLTRIREVVGFEKQPFFGENHLRGQVIVITGANQGIGKETVYQLACMGATKIFMLCRSPQRAAAARKELLERESNKLQPSQLEVIPMDLGSYASVRNAVDTLQEKLKSIPTKKIRVLINNAGLMMGTQTTSVDGHDLMMQANHLGHFLLTNLLIQNNMLEGDNVRILTISSSTHELATSVDFDDFFCTGSRPYTLFGQYSMSKLANILFAKELARHRFEKNLQFRSYAIHPGIVRTNVTSNMQWYWRVPNLCFGLIVASLQKIPSEGAYSQVHMAAAPLDMLPENGSYISNGKVYQSSTASESMKDAKRLWDLSERLVGNKGVEERRSEEEKKE